MGNQRAEEELPKERESEQEGRSEKARMHLCMNTEIWIGTRQPHLPTEAVFVFLV